MRSSFHNKEILQQKELLNQLHDLLIVIVGETG